MTSEDGYANVKKQPTGAEPLYANVAALYGNELRRQTMAMSKVNLKGLTDLKVSAANQAVQQIACMSENF